MASRARILSPDAALARCSAAPFGGSGASPDDDGSPLGDKSIHTSLHAAAAIASSPTAASSTSFEPPAVGSTRPRRFFDDDRRVLDVVAAPAAAAASASCSSALGRRSWPPTRRSGS